MTNSSKKQKKGFSLTELINQGKLAWKLFRDPNVSPLVRYGIPLLGLAYVIFPADILPDFIPVLGQLDDAAVLMLLAQLLIALAPDNIVAMYRQASQAAGFDPGKESAAKKAAENNDDDVIDVDYRVVP